MSGTILKKNMNEEIKKYETFVLNNSGKLIRASWIKTTDDYDHNCNELHHYILFKNYEKNKSWYEERGIRQKLILVSKVCHEQIHNQAIKNLTDEEFKARYNISRWDLFFNRRHTDYGM